MQNFEARVKRIASYLGWSWVIEFNSGGWGNLTDFQIQHQYEFPFYEELLMELAPGGLTWEEYETFGNAVLDELGYYKEEL